MGRLNTINSLFELLFAVLSLWEGVSPAPLVAVSRTSLRGVVLGVLFGVHITVWI